MGVKHRSVGGFLNSAQNLEKPRKRLRLDRLIFLPVIGALIGIWGVLIAFTGAERRNTLERADIQLGFAIATLADADALAEREAAESADRRSEIRAAAIAKALQQYPKASIWLESNDVISGGAPPVGDIGSFLVVDEKRETFTAHAALPIDDVLTVWRQAVRLRYSVAAAVSIVLLSLTGLLARSLRQRAKSDSVLRAINDSAALLMSEQDLDTAITGVLGAVGPTIEATRTFLVHVVAETADRVVSNVGHEWFAPGMVPLRDLPGFRDQKVRGSFSDAVAAARPQAFIGQEAKYLIDDFPEPLRSQNINAGIRSVLSLSLMVDGQFESSLVFSDSSPKGRRWNQSDVDTLKTLARLISAAAARARYIAQRERAISGLRLRDRALEGISQGVTITDDKAPGYPIIYTNPAFAALTRYTVDEIIGRGSLSFFDASVAAHIVERTEKANTAKKPWRMETSLKRKDGTSFLDSMVTTMIVDQHGDITHSVTIHEDVTEVRRREELLLEAQKMESVGQLTGGIAHDFNNLLTAIKSNAEDLRDDLKDNPLLQSQAEVVLAAADRGAGLVAQLMAFARKQELQPKVTDVNELLDRVGKLLRSTLPAHVDIDMRKAARLPAVYVDPGRLETAILNLAINARDAMPDGGTVTIETSLKNLDADYVSEHIEVQQGDYVLIAVTDTGTGMAPEIVERAFVPFFTTKEVGKGTGLGLSMVYGFVKQSGGHAMIYSEKGLGTVVKIYLPAMDQVAPSGDQPTEVGEVRPGTGSILLVEDDAIVRQSISGKLTRLGYKVVTASNALEAIETLKRNPNFNLVFSDVIMPGPMNGADLVREVRRRWPTMNVLLTSGYTESTVLGKINLPTDVSLLSKPYSNGDLARIIGEAIGRSSNDAI